MKKFIAVLMSVTIAMMLFVGCDSKKDEEPEKITVESFNGCWECDDAVIGIGINNGFVMMIAGLNGEYHSYANVKGALVETDGKFYIGNDEGIIAEIEYVDEDTFVVVKCDSIFEKGQEYERVNDLITTDGTSVKEYVESIGKK